MLADDSGPEGMLGFASGEQVYMQICQGCHMPDGRGAQGAGYYPALAGDPGIGSLELRCRDHPQRATQHAGVRPAMTISNSSSARPG